MTIERTAYAIASTILAVACVLCLVFVTLSAMRRTRPRLSIAAAVAVGLTFRLVEALVLPILAPELLGPDEQIFLRAAEAISGEPLLSHSPFDPDTPLHVWLFAFQMNLGFPEAAMRVIQVGFAVMGLLLMAVAVHDLAGPRAARLTSWLIYLEPATAFFGILLHKEALMTFSTGLVILGGVRYWARQDARAVTLLLAGCALAIAARPYAGWSLAAATCILIVHRGLLPRGGWRGRSLLAATIMVAIAFLSIPAVLQATSGDNLERLRASQEYNAADNSTLALEAISYNSRADLLLALPQRIPDLLLRPYPWQLGSAEQLLGLPGTLAAIATLWFLILAIASSRGRILRSVAPFVYPGLFLLAAYSVTTGNAGTSYRHRAQLVAIGICLALILRQVKKGSGLLSPKRG